MAKKPGRRPRVTLEDYKGGENHYINAKEFAEELKFCQENEILSEKMFSMFKKLAQRCSGSFYYQNPDDRYDCVMNAVMIMADKYMKFDFNRESAGPFSYFTSIAYNGIRAGWNSLNSGKSVTYRIDQIFTNNDTN